MSNETISIPSYNLSEVYSDAGKLDFFQKMLFMRLEKIAPAKIISYDRTSNRAVVQVLNYSITSTGDKIQRKPLSDIPVQVFGGGDFCLSFPIKEGDIGFIMASDGDISVFKKLLQIFAPASYQKHKYKDGVFFPLIINGFSIATDDKDTAVLLSSLDGVTKISVKPDYITMTAENVIVNSTNTTINATDTTVNSTNTTVNSDLTTINSETAITKNLTISENLTVVGDITASNITALQMKSTNSATGTFDTVTVEDGIVTGGS